VAELPSRLNLRITDRCDRSCLMCGQAARRALAAADVEERGATAAREFSAAALARYLPPALAMPVAEGLAVADPASPRARLEAYIWGGEPLLRQDLPKLVALLRERGFRTIVNSSGSLLERRAAELAAVDEWVISIDGPEPIHDAIRGERGLYRRLLRGVDALRRHSSAPCHVNFTISERNYDSLAEFAQELERGPWNELTLQLPTYATHRSGALFDAAIERHCGSRPARPSWRHFQRSYRDIDCNRLARSINLAYALLGERLRMIPYRLRDASALRRYFADPLQVVSRKRGRCLALGNEISVEPDGSVVGCPDFPDVVLGWIDDAPWPHPWHAAGIQRLRRAYVEDGLGVCARCCRYF
jgi:MoaA/NifB/PqqE/SkfB family radical SAM enzyme